LDTEQVNTIKKIKLDVNEHSSKPDHYQF